MCTSFGIKHVLFIQSGEPGISYPYAQVPPQALLTSIYHTYITFPPHEHHVPYLAIPKNQDSVRNTAIAVS